MVTVHDKASDNLPAHLQSRVAIYAATFGLSLAYGLQVPLGAITLKRSGASGAQIGRVASATLLGVVVCGPLAYLIGKASMRRAI
jgi:hypothetical protein